MSSYSPDLRIELIDSGAQAGTWGTTTNNTFAYLLEAAIAGYQTVSVTSANQALTHINGASATAGDNQSVYAMLRFTTTTGAAFNVYAPPASKQYIVYNNSGYSMTIYNSTVIGNTTAAGTGVTVTNGSKVMVWSDGTNFSELQAANLTGTLAVANGGTGATSFTSGALLKGAGTSAVTTASAADIAGQIGTLPVANGGTGVTTAAAITSLVGNLLFPVGAIYSSTSSTNPGSSLGFGTWTQFAAGRMMMGAGGSFSPGTTGGSNDAITVSHTHTASVSDPGHRHGYDDAYFAELPNSGILGSGDSDYDNSYVYRTPRPNTDTVVTGVSVSVSTTGSSGTNANLPPFIVVYMWQRTA